MTSPVNVWAVPSPPNVKPPVPSRIWLKPLLACVLNRAAIVGLRLFASNVAIVLPCTRANCEPDGMLDVEPMRSVPPAISVVPEYVSVPAKYSVPGPYL